MNIEEILMAVAVAVLAKQTSFRLGNYTVTVTATAGAPAHLTFQQALTAAGMVLAGQVGTIVSGDVTVVIAPTPPTPT